MSNQGTRTSTPATGFGVSNRIAPIIIPNEPVKPLKVHVEVDVTVPPGNHFGIL